MESYIGEYITKEYGLLKQILSYLKPCDLRNAKLVCREWKSAVESLVEKKPLSIGLWSCRDLPIIFGERPMLPALVLYQNVPISQKDTWTDFQKCEMCKQTFMICPCRVSDSETMFISLDSLCHITHNSVPGRRALYMFWQTYSAFLLPSSPKMRVSTFYVESKSTIFKEPVTNDVVDRCVGGAEPIKCLIIISKAVVRPPKNNWLNQLINKIIERQGFTFAVGGGDIRGMLCKKGYDFSQGRYKKPVLVLIALRGESVTAHSDILSSFHQHKVETFIDELASRVGPLPVGATRIAFIAQCVDRADEALEAVESTAFARAFPTVPQYGFRAYGEYGMRSCSSGDCERRDSSKRMKMTFDRAHTSSFIILTFKEV